MSVDRSFSSEYVLLEINVAENHENNAAQRTRTSESLRQARPVYLRRLDGLAQPSAVSSERLVLRHRPTHRRVVGGSVAGARCACK